MEANKVVFRPQPGPQWEFLASEADIAIYGGAAGGGKTWSLLADAARLIDTPGYYGTIFRREISQITLQGGLWDESQKIYTKGKANISDRKWTFPSGSTIKFEGCEQEMDVLKFQGAQFGFLGFDELTHFTARQFWYLWSRVRSMTGKGGRTRATCNPDPLSWVKVLIKPWLDGVKKSGELAYYLRDESGELIEVEKGTPDSFSLTFIPARLEDNKALMEADPNYRRRLLSLPLVERMALLDGSWDEIVEGDFFNALWWQYVDRIPQGLKCVRFWDMAATKPKPGRDPDYTVGLLMGRSSDGQFTVMDVERFRESPAETEKRIKACAMSDGRNVSIRMEQEGGSSGIITIDHYARNVLAGFDFKGSSPNTSKQERAKPGAAAVENGLVFLPSGATWTMPFKNELARFPNPKIHDDQVDAFSGAYNALATPKGFWFEEMSG